MMKKSVVAFQKQPPHMKYLLIAIVLLGFLLLGAALYPGDSLIIFDTGTPQETEDLPEPLQNPPDVVMAVYLTSWSAGLDSRINYVIDLVSTTDINAVVIDVKDFSGYVAYDMPVSQVKQYKAVDRRIRDINALIRRLHDNGIYVIARISVFQDPVLASARPDLAIHSSSTGAVWKDRKDLSWIDPASPEAWAYTVAIARDIASRGFDELNFDYIRFPTDGNLEDMQFPVWDERAPMRDVIKAFFAYLRQELPDRPISADLFGLTTVAEDDMGIGQYIEDAYEHFDFVAPMIYPSHYASWAFGFENPAEHPYEIVARSITKALDRLVALETSRQSQINSFEEATRTATTTDSSVVNLGSPPQPIYSKLRPWVQDFDIGADYDADKVRAQIRAIREMLGDRYAGYMVWSPSNVYTREAFIPEK